MSNNNPSNAPIGFHKQQQESRFDNSILLKVLLIFNVIWNLQENKQLCFDIVQPSISAKANFHSPLPQLANLTSLLTLLLPF